ncbi:hypothetical protein F2Q70_00017304 [Brassica cretica]|uniref:Uncharacterized protein n=1 Tax=Brassica cretica TaxID=69181 RepID=A0A8S9HUU3_BRACR|nr:hypothetical protein F2Q70_00017304 [Brassica cretica]
MEQATAGQIQNQNQRQSQSNRQAVPATGNSQPDELKGLGMMMQQLLQVTAPDESAETPPSRVYVPKVPYPIPPRHLMDPISEEQLIGFNKMVRRLPKEIAFEDALQIRPLLKFFKNCRETQEEIKVLYTKALSTPALKVLPKVDDPGKSLKEISSELTIRGRYEEEAIVRCTSSAVDRYIREASTIEDYDRSMYILYHRSMSRCEMRDLVPADFKPKASPNYKITTDEFLT